MRDLESRVCIWTLVGDRPPGLDELRAILNCAAARGCDRCVACSERALSHVMELAGKRPPEAESD